MSKQRKVKVKPVNPIAVNPEPVTFTIKPQFKYEKHILKMLTIEGFYAEWISRLPHTQSHEEAYETAEIFFKSYFDKRRFKNYETFKSSVSKWLKNR